MITCWHHFVIKIWTITHQVMCLLKSAIFSLLGWIIPAVYVVITHKMFMEYYQCTTMDKTWSNPRNQALKLCLLIHPRPAGNAAITMAMVGPYGMHWHSAYALPIIAHYNMSNSSIILGVLRSSPTDFILARHVKELLYLRQKRPSKLMEITSSRLLKSAAAMINMLAAYHLVVVTHCVKTVFIARILLIINWI